jgi:hypothetical protein
MKVESVLLKSVPPYFTQYYKFLSCNKNTNPLKSVDDIPVLIQGTPSEWECLCNSS